MRLILLVLAIASLPGVARGEGTAMKPAAREHLARGAQHYARKEYDQAIEELEAGLRLDPHPDFLYALGQAERNRGDCKKAIQWYEEFLRTTPPRNAAFHAETNLARCRAALAVATPQTVATLQTPATPQPALEASSSSRPLPPAETPRRRDWLGVGLAGAGGVALAAGITFLALGNAHVSRANDAASLAEREREARLGSRDRSVGTVAVAVGGGLVVGATVRLVW